MLFCVAIVAVFPSVSLGAVTTCPSGYTTVNESDAIYVSNTGSCSAGHTQLGGDMELKNCYTSQNAPMCTYYDEIYTAVYNCNGGSGDTSESVIYGNTFTPKTNVCTRANYEFDGWTIDGTDVGSSFTWSYLSDKTLTARWKQVSCDDGKMLIDGACVDAEFTIETIDMAPGAEFTFEVQIEGTYYVDWGDGSDTEKIEIKHQGCIPRIPVSHTYANGGKYTVGMSGQAVSYSYDNTGAAECYSGKECSAPKGLLNFANNTNIMKLGGKLGNVFGVQNESFSAYELFKGCSNLIEIPEDLFDGFESVANFNYAFYGCSSLTEIPDTLFNNVANEWASFDSTFANCASLKNIPDNLFIAVKGVWDNAFKGTFANCTSLTEIPENLFAPIEGEIKAGMFDSTFAGCTGLTKLPNGLFKKLTGRPKEGYYVNVCYGEIYSSFDRTFAGCTNLSGYIPTDMFENLDSTDFNPETMSSIFANTKLDTTCPSGTYQYITGFESAWSGKVSCAPCPNGVCYTVTSCGGDAGVGEKRCYYDATTNDYTKCDDTCVYTSCNDGYIMTNGACVKFEPEFTITTTSNTSSFSFQISAAGNYTISWGDGNVEQISKSNVTLATYSHNYNTAGKYEINISGQATGYNTDVNTPSVSFSQNKNIAKISGSLGAIFGTLSNGDNPRFKESFYACTNMSGPIPADLFAGITGKPTKRMFMGLFSDCTSLSGEIPADLFSGLTGAVTEYMFRQTFFRCTKLTGGIPSGLFRVTGTPQIYMFMQTFRGCTGLTGTIGDGLFAGIKGAPAEAMFQDTFSQILPRDGGTDMNLTGSIPANLFAGISGAPASMMFYNTFYGCSKLSGTIPGDLFKGIKGQLNGTLAFQYTFEKCAGLTGYIPPELFAGVTYSGTYPTTGKGDMRDIFNGATGLATSCSPYGLTEYTTIFKPDWSGKVSCFKPEFSITTINMPANTSYKFTLGAAGTYYIDWGDGSAIQTINKTDTSVILVSHTYASAGVRTIGISGQATGYYTADDGRRAAVGFSWGDNVNATANHYTAKISGSLGAIFGTLPDGTQPRFNYTFYQSPNLTGTIPENLFSGIQGQPISYMFDGTFFKTGLTGQIPGGLFKDIVGKPVTFLFTSTFSDNYNMVSTIPSELFSGIQGAPAPLMFYQTFYKNSKMNGEIPADLFAKIKGAPAKQMFRQTFAGCSGLTGSIPENLFSGIEGAPAQEMFNQTFSGCTGLTGQIPPKLFWGITGMPASNMYYGTFQSCTGLTGNVPVELFGRINNTNYQSGPMSNVFYGSGIKTTCPDGMIQYHTGFDIDFSDRKACWKPDIIITTTELPAGAVFRFSVSAMADYTIDWGDGTRVEALSKKTTDYENLSHKYDKAGTYTIGLMANNVTGYANPNIGEQYSAISFSAKAVTSNTACSYIKGIKGGLGAMFPTLSDGSQPSFRAVFQNCNELEGAIPSDLFKGVSGQPVKYMFQEVFSGCTKLTGPIPSDLFADISGTATDHLFYGLFDGCTGLTGEIPENLFKNISGGSEGASFSNVFRSCSKLTGSIPDKLFANLDSHPGNRVFSGTFDGCSGLTGEIPADLFASVAGAPEEYAFYMTFANCSGLTGEIPGDLFKTIKTDTPQPYMFFGTFQNCSGLTGSIPGDLFSGIKGAPAEGMFNDTFDGCSGLTGSIPADLFSGIDGAPAPRMFEGTFKGNIGLTGSIPATLFKGIRGAAATRMFENTFQNCSGLTGYIPAELFVGIPAEGYESGPMVDAFNGTRLEESCPTGMYKQEINFEVDWDNKAMCVKCPDGFTSKVGADSADDCDIKLKKLHIGDDTLYITPNKPASTPVMAFRVDGTTYYGGLSDTEKTLNDETETKYNVLYNGKHYYLYDATVQ